MLSPGSPSGLDREEAMRLLAELERLRRRGRALARLTQQLQATVAELETTLY